MAATPDRTTQYRKTETAKFTFDLWLHSTRQPTKVEGDVRSGRATARRRAGRVNSRARCVDIAWMGSVLPSRDPITDAGRCSPVARYRIAPWPIRVLIPAVALVAIGGLVHDHTAPVVSIPLVVAAAIAYILAAERCGLYASARGLESRMTRRANSFRYRWSEIERFEPVDNGYQVAVVVQLRDGSARILPSTRAWRYQRASISDMCAQLNQKASAG